MRGELHYSCPISYKLATLSQWSAKENEKCNAVMYTEKIKQDWKYKRRLLQMVIFGWNGNLYLYRGDNDNLEKKLCMVTCIGSCIKSKNES